MSKAENKKATQNVVRKNKTNSVNNTLVQEKINQSAIVQNNSDMNIESIEKSIILESEKLEVENKNQLQKIKGMVKGKNGVEKLEVEDTFEFGKNKNEQSVYLNKKSYMYDSESEQKIQDFIIVCSEAKKNKESNKSVWEQSQELKEQIHKIRLEVRNNFDFVHSNEKIIQERNNEIEKRCRLIAKIETMISESKKYENEINFLNNECTKFEREIKEIEIKNNKKIDENKILEVKVKNLENHLLVVKRNEHKTIEIEYPKMNYVEQNKCVIFIRSNLQNINLRQLQRENYDSNYYIAPVQLTNNLLPFMVEKSNIKVIGFSLLIRYNFRFLYHQNSDKMSSVEIGCSIENQDDSINPVSNEQIFSLCKNERTILIAVMKNIEIIMKKIRNE